jgi:Fe-S-cluster-containing dehydrogenase component
MADNRRDFLKKSCLGLLGLGAGLPLLRTLASPSTAGEPGRTAGAATKQYGMVIDIKKCQNEQVRRACREACNREHNIPSIPDPQEEIKWIWSEPFENTFPEQVHPYSHELQGRPVLVLCNHCTDPGCVRVCPTQATWKRQSDGIVMMDMHRCIGCRFCMAGCPYGARSFNFRDPRPFIAADNGSTYPTRTKGVVEKCNFCAERLREGRRPACVEAADALPGAKGALIFGDLADPDSEITRVLRDNYTIARNVSAGTGPNIFYIV